MGKILTILFLFLLSCQKIGNISSAFNDSSAKRTATKNIIFILIDDFGYELPTYTGGQSYLTPNIDNLAANGKQFLYAHSCPVCSPSRSQLLTGQYTFRNYESWGVLPNSPTIAQKLRDAGYATCVSGKWQLDGGDAGIHNAGFDKYCVWNPFAKKVGNKYKNPEVYQDAAYLTNTAGKYGDDIFKDYMLSFIDSNQSNPFFVYWATNLVHVPWQPTPDDPEFATYDPETSTNLGEKKYYPSMVKYADKLIGQLVSHLDSLGLLSNTQIYMVGDNGTSHYIVSQWNGTNIRGDKNGTTLYATHVPLIVYQQGVITPSVDTSLVDFTDFMPTILNAAGVVNTTFTDGFDFLNNSQRKWVFVHHQPNPDTDPTNVTRWIMDRKYKEYDSGTALLDSLINYTIHPKTEKGLLNLTKTTKPIDSTFKSVLNYMH